MSRPRWITAVVIAVLLVALVAASAVIASVTMLDRERGPSHGGAAPTGVPPLDLASVSPQVAGLYRHAASHAREYAQIPCWCGCEQFLDHRNLADCFVRADGRGWEAHASGCSVCLGEAAIAREMLAAGRAPSDVKAVVDERFGATAITTPPTID